MMISSVSYIDVQLYRPDDGESLLQLQNKNVYCWKKTGCLANVCEPLIQRKGSIPKYAMVWPQLMVWHGTDYPLQARYGRYEQILHLECRPFFRHIKLHILLRIGDTSAEDVANVYHRAPP